ncbi:glycosyltransferase family 4 protein [Promineifilum sp.]|uniref:glycosyltransferase family 4 protein n=1 Tax=Promineifilum sp. TaxID=2664178 RepID=UPI0035B42EDC
MSSQQQPSPRPGVLIIVENLPVPNDRRVWLEATALRDAGYHVSVISITGANATERFERREGVALYRYPAPPTTSGTLSFIWEFTYCWIQTFLLSLKILRREGFDIVHACNPPETFWLIGRFYKLFGKQFIFDHHDLSPEMYLSRFGRQGMAYRLLLLLERLTFRTADVVITTNETHRQVALTRGQVPPERIFIVRSGPNHHVLYPSAPDPALKRGRAFLVSYLGVLNPQDGVDTFVRVADVIVRDHGRRDIQFVIMGSGDAEAGLRALSAELGLDDYLHFTGWAELDLIRRYLSTSDVCVDTMPKTPYSDAATMNKILEYMSVGRAIAVFDLVESRVSAGAAARYAIPDDAQDLAATILDLLADPARREEMGRLGRRRIEDELAWEHQKVHLLAAYEACRALKRR